MAAGNPWGVLRSVLHERVSFGDIKSVVGRAGIDPTRLAHLEQKSGSGGASKSQLLSAIDHQVAEFDSSQCEQFNRAVVGELLRRQPDLRASLQISFNGIGWTLEAGGLVTQRQLDRGSLDHLTGLLNRQALDSDLQRDIDEALASRSPISIVFVDVDHFKRVNDQHGHGVGDKVLKGVADHLKAVVDRKGSAYRYGGEEMVVVLRNHSTEEAVAVAERARRELEMHPIDNISVTASFGVSSVPEHGRDAASALHAADAAVYDAKRLGRNLVRVPGEPEPSGTPVYTRAPSRKVAQLAGMSEDKKQHLRKLHCQGHVIKCPHDLTPLDVTDMTTAGAKGRELFVACPLCGFTETLDAPG